MPIHSKEYHMKDLTIQLPLPLMTAKLFAELTGLDLGVVEAQMDRRILPVLRIGKRRVVNLEALRLLAQHQAEIPGGAAPGTVGVGRGTPAALALPPLRRSGVTPLSNTGINK